MNEEFDFNELRKEIISILNKKRPITERIHEITMLMSEEECEEFPDDLNKIYWITVEHISASEKIEEIKQIIENKG